MLAAVCLTACSVHEFPDTDFVGERHEATFELRFTDIDMPLHTVVHYSPDGTRVVDAPEGTMRYIVRAYRRSDIEAKQYSRPTVDTTFCRTVTGDADCTVALRLPAGDYSVYVWADLAADGVAGQWHYDAADFSAIARQTPHVGDTPLLQAFRGTTDITIDRRETIYDETAPAHGVVTLKRPLARVEFMADDYEEFLAKYIAALAKRQEETRGDAPTRAIEVSDFEVTVQYDAFMPYVYNAFTDKPIDSATGVTFRSIPTAADEHSVLLAYDYIMVNGHESSVPMSIVITDREHTFSVASSTIDVPIVRGKKTIVRGAFFSSRSQSGLGISPEFSGEWNIEIK